MNPLRKWLRRGGVAAALIGALPLALPAAQVVHAAATTTVAFWSMDEAPGSIGLVDSAGAQTGTIGSDVQVGVRVDGATAHRFPKVPTATGPTYPGHLDRVPDSATLDPGTSDYAVTIRYRTTENFGNIAQKGQNQTAGGYWKFEAPNGVVTCLFKGETGAQRAVSSVNPLNDGSWHTVRCEQTSTALTMTVDGVRTQRLAGNPGNISNAREVTIGGKGVCDQVTVTCDYFVGDIDYVRIEKGTGGPANAAPTAAFAENCVGLSCSFDASATSDLDGAVQTYAWSFGDASTGAYVDPTHMFAAPGTYTVTLTVTDDRGATSTTAHDVTVAPAPEVISFVGQSSTSGNTATPTANVPAGVQAGDALLLFFAHNNDATVGTPTGVTGWIPLDSTLGGYGRVDVWRKVATAADAGAPVRIPLSRQAKGSLIVAAYRGTSVGDPVAAYAKAVDTTVTAVRTTPTAAVASPQSWAVSYWMHGDSTSTALTAPAGVVARAGGTQTGSGRVTTLLADSGASVPPPSYGGLTLTAPTASNVASMWTIVLAPYTGPVANQPPTAQATSSCLQLTCTFSSAGTSDSDGIVMNRSWAFGDGTSSTAADPSHTYAQPGTYTATLTATDDDGAVATATTTVTVPYVPPTDVISFVGRSSVDIAGTSTLSTPVPAAVQPGDGLLLLLAVNSTASVSGPTGVPGWQSLGVVTAGSVRTRAWRKVAGAGDAASPVTVTLGAAAKATLTVLAYRGTDPTDPVAVAGNVALTDNVATRPSPAVTVSGSQQWVVTWWAHKDSITAALAAPAGVTTRATGTQSSTGHVTTLAVDSGHLVTAGTYGGLVATATAASTTATAWTIVLAPAASTPPPPPPANVAPTAAFTSSCAGSTCSFDATGSADSDGTLTSWAWEFGDGTTGVGAQVEHTFADGTHSVALTVTDDDGATGSVSHTVTLPVVAPVDVITFVGSASSNLNATSHSVRIPSEVQPGDGLLLLFSENTTATITEPPGWTVLDTASVNGTVTRVWRKVASAADAGTTVTIGVSAISKAGLTVLAYRGTSPTDPIAAHASATFASGTARTTPVVDVTGARSWVVSYWTHKDSSTDALTPPAEVVVRASGTQTSGGRVTTLVADSGALVPTGATGGLTATAAAASSTGTAWTIVLAAG